MSVLHRNKDSLMAVLEAFVYDPLLNWRLIEGGTQSVPGAGPVRSKSSSTPTVSASVSSTSDGVNSAVDAYSEAANNSLNVNPKKQLTLENLG
jgi:FKBP12-rapamycin complex-associated protein